MVINFGSERKKAEAFLLDLATNAPGCLIGYDTEIESLWKKDKEQVISLVMAKKAKYIHEMS